MKWIKYRIKTVTEAEDILVSNLYDIGLEGAQIEDKVPLTPLEKEAMFVDILPDMPVNDDVAYLSCFVENDGSVDREKILADIKEVLKETAEYCEIGEGTVEVSETEDVDWINNWKQYFQSFSVDEFRVIPSWEKPGPEDAGKRILHIDLCRGGETVTVRVKKGEYEPLGLSFETSLMSRMQTCRNHCMFCFIDQMPRGVRTSLQVKDDDWRMSFIMGNYVTLTNVDDEEFARILKRKISPLYVSVYAIDPETRTRIMRNPEAGRIRERLEALKQAGLRFHAQIVLCPGINDGDILEETLTVLGELAPACASVAVVPVGVTRFRERLEHLDVFDQPGSLIVVRQIERFQGRAVHECF